MNLPYVVYVVLIGTFRYFSHVSVLNLLIFPSAFYKILTSRVLLFRHHRLVRPFFLLLCVDAICCNKNLI